MGADDRSATSPDVGRKLRELLAQPVYRAQWESYVRQRPSASVNQAAVARLLADFLVDTGERDYRSPDLARHLKDRVGRALTGQRASPETLRWLIEAFSMSEGDRQQLWAAFRAGATTSTGAATHHNVAIHELHTVGVDGVPLSHRTVQVLRAGRHRITHYTYKFDTDAASVEIIRGGVAGPVYPCGNGLSAVDIALHRPLEPGDTASLEYLTTFAYRDPPSPEFRRGAVRPIDSLELRVQFHRSCRPRRIWWARWRHLDGSPVHQEPVALDPEHAVHRYLSNVEATIVGFTWEW